MVKILWALLLLAPLAQPACAQDAPTAPAVTLPAATTPPAKSSWFEHPPALERDIQFWIRVYTEVNTDQGLLHDDWNLGVVYEVMRFAADSSRREREARVEAAKKHYRSLLARFAAGELNNLSDDEQRILHAFGETATPATFKDAMDGVRFQLGQANRFREGLMRAGIWEAHIARTLSQRGVPAEVAALPHVESSFNPAAYSRVGAAGLWQFMRSTARRYMRVDSLVDERLDPFTATEAAANLMLYNYRLLGTWPLAVTAYNHGPGGLLRAQSDLGTSDIATIVRHYNGRTFGFASRNFYVAFLAALEVDKNAQKYFGPIPRQPDPESTTVELPDYIPMSSLITAFKVDQGAMRALNPALRPPIWSGARWVPRGYALRIPGTVNASALEAALVRVPSGQRYLAQRSDPTYRVRRGESLASIAQGLGLSMDRLLAANSLRESRAVKRGEVLKIPAPGSRAGAQAQTVSATATVGSAEAASFYVVRPGETLAVIAKLVGISEDALKRANALRDSDSLYPGQHLTLNVAAQAAALAPVLPPITAALVAPPVLPVPPLPPVLAPRNEPVTERQADAAALLPGGAPSGNEDPSDYSVSPRGTIIVQAAETLGHYADWSGVTAAQLRKLNHLKKGAFVNLGHSVKLDLSRASVAQFETLRHDYHKHLQDAYFAAHRITGTETYAVKRGESLWTITQQRPDVPVWLLRQYNPRVDFSDVRPGTAIALPKVVAANRQ